MLRSLIKYQTDAPLDSAPRKPDSPPRLTDPVSLTTQFLLPTQPGPVEIHVSAVRVGRAFTNLQARLLHRTGGDNPGECTITAQAIFTRLPPLPGTDASGRHPPVSDSNLNLFPLSDSPYAMQSPMLTHPSKLEFSKDNKWDDTGRRWSKQSTLGSINAGLFDWVADPEIDRRRAGTGEKGERLTLEWGAWFALLAKEDVIDTVCLA